jgi:hypothetical protein
MIMLPMDVSPITNGQGLRDEDKVVGEGGSWNSIRRRNCLTQTWCKVNRSELNRSQRKYILNKHSVGRPV